jgi:CrcB protein
MTTFLLVAIGGGLGSMARASLSALLVRRMPAAAAVLVINALGSLMIGVAVALALAVLARFNLDPAPEGFTFFAVGLLGGFTTVSTFALQVHELWNGVSRRAALATALGSVLACPMMAALGFWMALALRGFT